MAEPSTSSISITALAIAVLGPMMGPYALIVFAALAGALWPLSTMPTVTRMQGAAFLVRVVALAVVLTGTAAYWIETKYKVPAVESVALVAFCIGAMGNGWRPVLQGLRGALVNLVSRLGEQRGDQQGGPSK
jgi:hypothetical protein